jgi:hypothetical protein
MFCKSFAKPCVFPIETLYRFYPQSGMVIHVNITVKEKASAAAERVGFLADRLSVWCSGGLTTPCKEHG